MILGLKSFLNTFMALSWVDFVFFIAVLALIILIVTLIYFIKINNTEEEIKNDIIKISDIVNETPISIAPLAEDEKEEEELLDLKAITEALEQRENKIIDMTEYEEEQEQRAIISYDELLERTSNHTINYEEEQDLGDLTIKKVDLDNLVAPENNEQPKMKVAVQVISYQKEEAFLEALKKLQEQLN